MNLVNIWNKISYLIIISPYVIIVKIIKNYYNEQNFSFYYIRLNIAFKSKLNSFKFDKLIIFFSDSKFIFYSIN
jgi:hypothetical protein